MEKVNKTSPGSLKFSIRITDKVTSISLRKNIISLWLVKSKQTNKNPTRDAVLTNIQTRIQNFIYLCLTNWEQNTGKGLSDYISEKMIQEILTNTDFVQYKQIKQILTNPAREQQ